MDSPAPNKELSVFPNWKEFAVPQRRSATGCIPTGYEFLLRAAGAQGIDFSSFQDEFDLDKSLALGESPQNNFVSVATAIKQRYDWVEFTRVAFPRGSGGKKVERVESLLRERRPTLVSIALEPFGERGWHIMPVVDLTDREFLLLHHMNADRSVQLCKLSVAEVARIHDVYEGGDDIAFLERSQGG